MPDDTLLWVVERCAYLGINHVDLWEYLTFTSRHAMREAIKAARRRQESAA